MVLALRLWAQTPCNSVFGKCVLLEHEDDYVLCVDAEGIACVVCEDGAARPTAALATGAGIEEPWPALQLRRLASGEPAWVIWPAGAAAHQELRGEGAAQAHVRAAARPPLTEAGRMAFVRAIHAYFRQHVLEPSVAGFLSILEKQFSRSDLYLFELLQNAVDEGAMRVSLSLSESPPALRFTHDGKSFTPLDVNGLSSVGMSTKAGKKAVGFMGIGFKACHKRFGHVVCADQCAGLALFSH